MGSPRGDPRHLQNGRPPPTWTHGISIPSTALGHPIRAARSGPGPARVSGPFGAARVGGMPGWRPASGHVSVTINRRADTSGEPVLRGISARRRALATVLAPTLARHECV